MHRIPDVRCVLGEDLTGFFEAGFQQNEISSLCELATHEYQNVLGRSLPPILVENAIREVPLGFHRLQRHGDMTGACTRWETYRIESTGESKHDRCIPLTGLKGLDIHVHPHQLHRQADIDILRSLIGHECIHIITHAKMSPTLRAPDEAMTLAIDRSIYEGLPDVLTNKRVWKWSRENTRGTDGFCPSNFSDIAFSGKAADALYLAAANAFENESEQELWTAAALLVEQGIRTGAFPQKKDIEYAMHTAFPRTSRQILGSPAFRDMTKEGTQLFWTRNSAESLAVVYPYTQTQLPEPDDKTEKYHSFTASSVRSNVQYEHNFYDKKRKRMKSYKGGGDLIAGELMSVDFFRGKLKEARNTTSANLARSLGGVEILLPGVPKGIDIFEEKDAVPLK